MGQPYPGTPRTLPQPQLPPGLPANRPETSSKGDCHFLGLLRGQIRPAGGTYAPDVITRRANDRSIVGRVTKMFTRKHQTYPPLRVELYSNPW